MPVPASLAARVETASHTRLTTSQSWSEASMENLSLKIPLQELGSLGYEKHKQTQVNLNNYACTTKLQIDKTDRPVEDI